MKILVINCGSSSLKFQLIDSVTEDWLAKGNCERIGIDNSFVSYTKKGSDKVNIDADMPDHNKAIEKVVEILTTGDTAVLSSLSEIDVVGHRVVHGGEYFNEAVLIDDDVIAKITELNELAPLHNPANLIGIKALQKVLKDTPMVAVFDTAFHQTMPEEAYLYGIPYDMYVKHHIRKYGFHGTSHSFVSRTACEFLNKDYDKTKVIVCHLGNGASVSAVKNGKCIDTSMGFTPLEGLIMGTRSGDIDPAVIEFMAQKENTDVKGVINILNKKSGVFGLSEGFSSDFRDLEDGYNANKPGSTRAVKAFCYKVLKYIGAYAAAMNGVDVICFTAGIGENTSIVRKLICDNLGYLGVTLDEEANSKRGFNNVISTPDSKVTVAVIPTNEELEITRLTVNCLEKNGKLCK
ncbi:MAG: acetate kinase [Lachnospiraceae bacterium]|nr:acetate kinase [Lachnospiraceae bacterium]